MAVSRTNILSDLDLRRWVKEKYALARSDGGGLTFTVSAAGTASWVLRYRAEGRAVELTLGRYPDLTLAAARRLASEKRVEVQQGRDPAAEKRKAKSRKDWTVRELVEDYRTAVMPTLARSTQQSYGRNLKRIEIGLGPMKIGKVEASDVVGLIERFNLGWVETNTLLIVQKAVFRRAAGRRLINVNPVLGVELSAIIGPRPKVRQRLMLTRDELAAVMNAQMSRENLLALRILLSTGVRASELFEARKEHVHLDEARWHIPSSKTGVGMDIPLEAVVAGWFSELALLSSHSVYVLPTRAASRAERNGGDAHISKDSIREAIDYWLELYKPPVRRFTPHDLRSTMKSHMRALGISRDISEMCLNHKLPGVEGIYDQYTYYEERKEAYSIWGDFLAKLIVDDQADISS